MQSRPWMNATGVLAVTVLLASLAIGAGGLLAGCRGQAQRSQPWPGSAKPKQEAAAPEPKKEEAAAEPKKEEAPAEPQQAANAEPQKEAAPAEPQQAAEAKPEAPMSEPQQAAATTEATPATPAAMSAMVAPGVTPSEPREQTGWWGSDFHTWDVVSGFVMSNSHGNRLVRTYISPHQAARIFNHNAELSRLDKTEGYLAYPAGTRIALQSWARNELGGAGQPGSIFFMRKESAGSDPSGGDWSYAITGENLSLLGEGHDGKMAFCKECHARAQQRDYVFATQR